MKQIKFCLVFLLALMFIGCVSQAEMWAEVFEDPVWVEIFEEHLPEPEPEPVFEFILTSSEEIFDPHHVSWELYDSTKHDVQSYIAELNGIISGKNYWAWKTHLTEEFFNEIASPRNLQLLSETPGMKARKIVLRTPEDYFNKVVVPARAHSRVDDIEFTSQTRVKVYTINAKNERLRLYDLEHVGDTWKIIN
jgi:hypothetical protein